MCSCGNAGRCFFKTKYFGRQVLPAVHTPLATALASSTFPFSSFFSFSSPSLSFSSYSSPLLSLSSPSFSTTLVSTPEGVSKAKGELQRIDDLLKQGKLRSVSYRDVYTLWHLCERNHQEYLYGLQGLNLLYNYGRSLAHSEMATRLLAFTLHCQEWKEALDVVSFYASWLRLPPTSQSLFMLMHIYFSQNKYIDVRSLFAKLRENWQIPLHSHGYYVAIQAMLHLESPLALEEAMTIYRDSYNFHVALPLSCHIDLQYAILSCMQPSSTQTSHFSNMTEDVEKPKQFPSKRLMRSTLMAFSLEVEKRMMKESCYFTRPSHFPVLVWIACSWRRWILQTCEMEEDISTITNNKENNAKEGNNHNTTTENKEEDKYKNTKIKEVDNYNTEENAQNAQDNEDDDKLYQKYKHMDWKACLYKACIQQTSFQGATHRPFPLHFLENLKKHSINKTTLSWISLTFDTMYSKNIMEKN